MTVPNDRNCSSPGAGPQSWTGEDGSVVAALIKFDWSGWLCRLPSGLADIPANWEIFDLSTISGNPLELPVDSGDTHHRLSVAQDKAGYYHVAGNTHGTGASSLHYVKSNVPNSILDGFSDASSTIDMSASGADPIDYRGTYDTFDRLSDGTLLWSRSQMDDAVSVVGRDHILFVLRPYETQWQPWGGNGELCVCDEIEDNGDPERAYIRAIRVKDDAVYLQGAWQWEALDQDTRNNMYVIRSLDFLESLNNETTPTWETMSGDPVTMPMTYLISAAADDCELPNTLSIDLISGTMAVDDLGNVYLTNSSYLAHDRHWWDGAAWQKSSAPRLGCYAYLRGEIVWISARYDGGPLELITQDGATKFFAGEDVPVNWAQMPDPTMAAKGVLRYFVPDGDNPRLIDIGKPTTFRFTP